MLFIRTKLAIWICSKEGHFKFLEVSKRTKESYPIICSDWLEGFEQWRDTSPSAKQLHQLQMNISRQLRVVAESKFLRIYSQRCVVGQLKKINSDGALRPLCRSSLRAENTLHHRHETLDKTTAAAAAASPLLLLLLLLSHSSAPLCIQPRTDRCLQHQPPSRLQQQQQQRYIAAVGFWPEFFQHQIL